VQTIPSPKILTGVLVTWGVGDQPWFPDSTRFLANSFQVGGPHISAWTVSVIGGAPRKLRDDARAWAASPDGTSVLFSSNLGTVGFRETWLMEANGEHARKLFGTDENTGVAFFRWSPGGQRLAYIRARETPTKIEKAIESRDLKGGSLSTILSETRLTAFNWLPDGRMIYSLEEPDPNGGNCNLWEARIDPETAAVRGEMRRLTNWAGSNIDNLTSTTDGKRLTFRKWSGQENLYVADLSRNGTHIENRRRMTLSEGGEAPFGWTHDSKSLIFTSSHNGQTGIFKQVLDQDSAETIVSGLPNASAAYLSPDGKSVLYIYPTEGATKLMRVPVTGGPSESVSALLNWYRCSRSPSNLCVISEISERTAGLKQIILSALDPIKGRGPELMRLDIDAATDYNYDISPDGTRIAILKCFSQGPIRIFSLKGQLLQEVSLTGLSFRETGFDWASDGKGFFICSHTLRGSNLLHVDLRGNVHVLWELKDAFGISSPDLRHIAMHGATIDSNIWKMEGF